MNFEKLFQQGDLGHLNLVNRIIMPPMGTNLWNEDGTVSKKAINYYRKRAAGGASLVTIEATAMHRTCHGRFSPYAYDDSCMEGMSRLVAAIKETGCKISIQLYHPGRQWSSRWSGYPIVAPSSIPTPPTYEMPREMTIDEITEFTDSWAESAKRCKQVGFDAIEIHGAHGYLLGAFLSPLANRRTDSYGGAIQSRARFPIEVVKAIKHKLGTDYPVIFRISVKEGSHGGLDIVEAKQAVKLLEIAGINAVSISAGTYLNPDWIVPSYTVKQGWLAGLCKEIKKSVKIPVICAGRVNMPHIAENILKGKNADFVAIGRALLADANLPRKAYEGNIQDIRQCIACNRCINTIFQGKEIVCTVNPELGHEGEFEYSPVSKKKRIIIVGGGPAGMSAAIVLKSRGHEVELHEKEDRLGGQLNIAAIPDWKRGYAEHLRYLNSRLDQLNVKIYLRNKVNEQDIKMNNPHAVIIATGAVPNAINVDAAYSSNVVQANHVLQKKASVGKHVVIIGGGLTGCDLALFLAKTGKRITIIEMLHKIGADLGYFDALIMMRELTRANVRMMPNASVKAISNKGVNVLVDGQEMLLFADTIVLAVGVNSDQYLYKALKASIKNLYCIGDAVTPRTAAEAIREGIEIGLKI
jgi:2,4-dienoyl-CoA reductase-like NADH-dependent reductase (Old Yellow Enzyme family)/thioredoxin reductase